MENARQTAQEEKSPALYDSYATLLHFSSALLAAAAALCVTQALRPLLGGNHAYWPLWPVVILAARFWGPASAALAAVAGWLGVWYWFIPPNNSFAIENRSDLVGVVGFIAVSGLIIIANLREYEMRHRVASVTRTVRTTTQALLAAYMQAACRCEDSARGHNLTCPAHWSVPVVIRAERSIQMLNGLAEDAEADQRRSQD